MLVCESISVDSSHTHKHTQEMKRESTATESWTRRMPMMAFLLNALLANYTSIHPLVCIYIYIFVCTYAYVHTYKCSYVHMHRSFIGVHTHTHTHTHTHVYMYIHTYIHITIRERGRDVRPNNIQIHKYLSGKGAEVSPRMLYNGPDCVATLFIAFPPHVQVLK